MTAGKREASVIFSGFYQDFEKLLAICPLILYTSLCAFLHGRFRLCINRLAKKTEIAFQFAADWRGNFVRAVRPDPDDDHAAAMHPA
jgi:hypothetical protein